MKTILRFLAICIFILIFHGCATKEPAIAENKNTTENKLTVDSAINEAASYFVRQLPAGAKVALIPFEAPTGRLSDYIFEELWSRFEDTRSFIMVDRKNLQRIETELNIQYSGRVDDNLMVSMSKQYGAEFIIHGQITRMDQESSTEYRMTVYATNVEKASSSQRAYTVHSESRLASLLNAPADEEVNRAVSDLAKAADEKIVIAVGRISYTGTQTVTGFSAWLKNSIIAGAQKQQDKFHVASDSESADFALASRGFTAEALNSPVQAVISGYYSPLDNGAEVTLTLTSTAGNRPVMASQRFAISASEMTRRKLSLLPGKGSEPITKTEFEAKQKAIDPYTGKDNRWEFTVSPDVLDGIYYDGDFMSMRIYSSRDCYFRITHVDVNGNTQVIYPIHAMDNNFIGSGETRRIPDNTYFLLHAPFGEEMILVAAYDQPFITSAKSGVSPLSAEMVAKSLPAQGDNKTDMIPSATAKLSYTILAR